MALRILGSERRLFLYEDDLDLIGFPAKRDWETIRTRAIDILTDVLVPPEEAVLNLDDPDFD